MMGLQKFDAIYSVNILNEIKSRLKGNLELHFKNDVDLYCMGNVNSVLAGCSIAVCVH